MIWEKIVRAFRKAVDRLALLMVALQAGLSQLWRAFVKIPRIFLAP